MEIHNPKPIHSWREFLTEIGIVVIGVCLALGAEQLVEWIHWRNEVAHARIALLSEIKGNSWFAGRVAVAPCLDRQVSEAGRIIDDLRNGRPPGRFTTFHPGYGNLLKDSEWQSERAAQVLTHFPRGELELLGRYYASLPIFLAWEDKEGDAWRELSVLRHPPASITTSDLLRLNQAYATARDMEEFIVLRAPPVLDLARRLGAPPNPPAPERVKQFCTLDEEAWISLLRSDRTTRPERVPLGD